MAAKDSKPVPIYVALGAECEHLRTGKIRPKTAHFLFHSQEIFDSHEEMMFDELIGPFNEWLTHNGYGRWVVSDEMEVSDIISESQAVKPYVVYKMCRD